MAHRKERLAHIIRSVVSDAISNRLSDPRISRFTSVTRVELSPDLKNADVFVSVMGSESDSKLTMKGLESARGAIQTRLARQLDIRQCPLLRIHLDERIKHAIDTIREIDEAVGDSPTETDDLRDTDDMSMSPDDDASIENPSPKTGADS